MALAFTLFGVLLILAALIAWQHAQRDAPSEITYGVEDAVSYVYTRLDPSVAERLGMGGLRRIIEWEVFYLQGLAQKNRRESVETVAGDYPPAVEFIGSEIARKHGLTYSMTDISLVLERETEYLASIGAVGEEAGGLEL
jgi:hypothetical protein